MAKKSLPTMGEAYAEAMPKPPKGKTPEEKDPGMYKPKKPSGKTPAQKDPGMYKPKKPVDGVKPPRKKGRNL
jgi:hypothetical protein